MWLENLHSQQNGKQIEKNPEFLAVGEQHQSLTENSAYVVEEHLVGMGYFGPVTTMEVVSGKRHMPLREYSLIF